MEAIIRARHILLSKQPDYQAVAEILVSSFRYASLRYQNFQMVYLGVMMLFVIVS